MNLIVISYMFPRPDKSYLGIFVKEQILEINKCKEISITVISPVAWNPQLLWENKEKARSVPYKYSLEGITVYRPRYFTLPGNTFIFLKFVAMFWSVINTIRKNKLIIDDTIIHSHWMFPDSLIAVILKRLYKIKVVCTAHGDDINTIGKFSNLCRNIIKYIVCHANAVIAVSGKLKDKITAICPTSVVCVIPNGFNLEMVTSVPERTSQIINSVNLLFVGNVCFEKGIRELLGALHRLVIEGYNVQLTIVGKIFEIKWIGEYIVSHQLSGRVALVGPVDYKEIFSYYRSADIFVLPSYSEGMPTVMFEAMACKLPVIISKVGGVDEVIKHGVNGLMIEPKSVGDLHEKLLYLIQHPYKAQELSNNAYHDAIGKYSWKHNATTMMKVYRELSHPNS